MKDLAMWPFEPDVPFIETIADSNRLFLPYGT